VGTASWINERASALAASPPKSPGQLYGAQACRAALKEGVSLVLIQLEWEVIKKPYAVCQGAAFRITHSAGSAAYCGVVWWRFSDRGAVVCLHAGSRGLRPCISESFARCERASLLQGIVCRMFPFIGHRMQGSVPAIMTAPFTTTAAAQICCSQ